ncbi:MAG: MCE family protein [Calditrichaeota bacterium]|nr:MAG: MCE family protein [Calditrichota bacterium]
MDFESSEIKAGMFIFISLAILLLFLIAIFGVNFGEKTKDYVIYFKYIGGIKKGSLVKYGGMDVGYVKEIKLPEDGTANIEAIIAVDEKTPVKTDSRAFITSIGIMADQHIEITPGSLTADLLPPGAEIPSKDVLTFAQISEPLSEMNKQIQTLLTSVNDLLNENNRSRINSMLLNMDKMLAEGQNHLSHVIQNLDKISLNLSDLTQEVNQLMNNNKSNFDSSLTYIKKTTQETTKLVADLRTTLSKFESILSLNSTNLMDILENFQFASQNLEEFTRMVKERPWLLVRKAAPKPRKTP